MCIAYEFKGDAERRVSAVRLEEEKKTLHQTHAWVDLKYDVHHAYITREFVHVCKLCKLAR